MHRLSVRQLLLVALLLLVAMPALADGPFRFYPITPCRLVDTRTGFGGVLTPNSTRDFQVQGVCGVPVGAKAAALNVTVFGPTSNGHLRLFPSGATLPTISTINFQSGVVIANGAVVSLSTNTNDLSVFTFLGAGGSSSTHLILDVTGYFAPAP
ncbi:MAG TPA: hypothetical protein VH394_22480 [Thermoanaerobaculia bacterium]|jgi:hypothetical protein|nr:hypothetical protein [Thermoanaerobaculia bacterium]